MDGTAFGKCQFNIVQSVRFLLWTHKRFLGKCCNFHGKSKVVKPSQLNWMCQKSSTLIKAKHFVWRSNWHNAFWMCLTLVNCPQGTQTPRQDRSKWKIIAWFKKLMFCLLCSCLFLALCPWSEFGKNFFLSIWGYINQLSRICLVIKE